MNASGRDEKQLEFKVGAMILIALALLVTFILILGDWTLTERSTVDVYFQNPGGLSAGAAVKVAGRKVGIISEMTFLGQDGPIHPVSQRPALVRTRVEIDADVYEALRRDVKFYITTKGMLGDPFLEIDPGVSPQKLKSDAPVFGTDPPRLDLFLADAAELVKGLNRLLATNADSIDKLIGTSARLLVAVEDLIDDDAGTGEVTRISRITGGIESLVSETRTLVKGAQEKFVDDPSVERSLDNLESLSGKLNREIGPLLKDVRESLAVVERLGDTIGPKEQRSIKESLSKLDSIAMRADRTMGKVEGMVDEIRTGKGTVGQLLSDEEIYDDLKELLRDLKHHPWKLIWED